MKAVGLTSEKDVKTLENIGYSVLHLHPSVCVDIHEESRLFVRFVFLLYAWIEIYKWTKDLINNP